jgi:hypothetical protein
MYTSTNKNIYIVIYSRPIKSYAYKIFLIVLYHTSLDSRQFRQYDISLTSVILLKEPKTETKIKNEEKYKVVSFCLKLTPTDVNLVSPQTVK